MSTGEHTNGSGTPDDDAARLRAVTELLEEVVRDRGLLGSLSVEERTRLLTAAADVFNPDVVQRRRFTKARRKQERDASIRADEEMLADTGIRVLRERPVFTTPNVYPPKGLADDGFEPGGLEREGRETTEDAALLRLQAARTASSTTSTTSSARRAPTFNFAQAHGDGRPRRARRRCSPAGASRSATRPASSCCAPART